MLKRIIRHLKRNITVVDTYRSYQHLRMQGYSPRDVFDVGAYKGEYAKTILKIWPDTRIYCFEVLPGCTPILHSIPGVVHVPCLAGERDLAGISFHQAETASSILEEHIPQDFPTITAPMTRLDTYCKQSGVTPDLLKIDTQGYEYQVLQGCGELLHAIEVIHVELNLIDIHKNVVLASDVIAFLRDHDFVPYDITELHRRPLDQALWQVDILFCKIDSPLRADKRWSA